jgi:hypothetical protein
MQVVKKNILQETYEGADRMIDIIARPLTSSPQMHAHRRHIREE